MMLLIEVGGTNIRAGLVNDVKAVPIASIHLTASFSGFQQFLEGLAGHFEILKSARGEVDVRIAGAGCFCGDQILSEHIPWLVDSFATLENITRRVGFRSLRFYNDMIAAGAAVLQDSAQSGLPSIVLWPCGVVGIGTGLGLSVIHALSENSFLICGSELGFAFETAEGNRRLRDCISGSELTRLLSASQSDLTDFVRRLEWLALLIVVDHKLQHLVLAGGVVEELSSRGKLTAALLERSLRSANVGSVQPIVDKCKASIVSGQDRALRGLVAIEQHADQSRHGQAEASLVMRY